MNALAELRSTAKRLRSTRARRDQLVREASENGATRREVAKAAGLSVGRVQQIVKGAVVACLALLVFAPGAWAVTDTTNHPRIQHLLPIAERAFPKALGTCYESISIEAGGVEGHEGSAWLPPNTGRPGVCEVHLAPTWSAWPRSKLCTTLVHEYGHLAGLGHSTDPHSVMYPDAAPRSVAACALYEERETALYLMQARLDRARYEIRRWRHKGRPARVQRWTHRRNVRERKVGHIASLLGP